jgi:hypothetical protein
MLPDGRQLRVSTSSNSSIRHDRSLTSGIIITEGR